MKYHISFNTPTQNLTNFRNFTGTTKKAALSDDLKKFKTYRLKSYLLSSL